MTGGSQMQLQLSCACSLGDCKKRKATMAASSSLSYNRIDDATRQRIIELVANKGKQHKEVAAIFGLPRTTVTSIVSTFRKQNRMNAVPRKGHKKRLLTRRQEKAVVHIVKQQNDITLQDIQQTVESDTNTFSNISSISLATIYRILKRNKITMKNLDFVPVSRNTPDTIEKRYTYVREMIRSSGQNFIYLDESGFNLHIRRRRGRNTIGRRATITLANARGGNISVLVAISEGGLIHFSIQLGPFNTDKFIDFLSELDAIVGQTPHNINMDNVSFHKSKEVTDWFEASIHTQMLLPPYSPFLNPTEEVFSKMKRDVGRWHSMTRRTLLDAIEAALHGITATYCQGWIRPSQSFFDACLDRESISNEPPPSLNSSSSSSEEED